MGSIGNLTSDNVVLDVCLLIHHIKSHTYYTLHINKADVLREVKSMIWSNVNHQPQHRYQIHMLGQELDDVLDTNDLELTMATWKEYTRNEESFEVHKLTLAIS